MGEVASSNTFIWPVQPPPCPHPGVYMYQGLLRVAGNAEAAPSPGMTWASGVLEAQCAHWVVTGWLGSWDLLGPFLRSILEARGRDRRLWRGIELKTALSLSPSACRDAHPPSTLRVHPQSPPAQAPQIQARPLAWQLSKRGSAVL